MTSERIAIPPDVAYGLQAAAGFKAGKLAFAAPSIAQALFFSAVLSAAVMAWAFDPTCINGRRIGPPRFSLIYYYQALSCAVLVNLGLAAMVFKGAVRRWHEVRDSAARSRAELDQGYLDVITIEVGPRHRLCDESDGCLLLVSVDDDRTAVLVLPEAEASETDAGLRSRLRVTVMPISQSIASIEFSGEPVTPNMAPSAEGSALHRYIVEHDLKWTMFGGIVGLAFERVCELAATSIKASPASAATAPQGMPANPASIATTGA